MYILYMVIYGIYVAVCVSESVSASLCLCAFAALRETVPSCVLLLLYVGFCPPGQTSVVDLLFSIHVLAYIHMVHATRSLNHTGHN